MGWCIYQNYKIPCDIGHIVEFNSINSLKPQVLINLNCSCQITTESLES